MGINTHVNNSREYLNSLQVPSPEQIRLISAEQESRERETMMRRQKEKAILDQQQSYVECVSGKKEYYERLIINRRSLSPSTRWVEAIREACYRKLMIPCARQEIRDMPGVSFKKNMNSDDNNLKYELHNAKCNWHKVGLITRRAGRDDESSAEEIEEDLRVVSVKERERKLITRQVEREKRRRTAKTMDLQYFLEMVDLKHRYGPNLRIYHEEWKKSNTKENFFYWLDYGEGLLITCQACPRERLDREQVRYLSKEERRNYLVAIDNSGRLRWAKNGALINTSENYRDSIYGIVPITDPTPIEPFAARFPPFARYYAESSLAITDNSSFPSSIEKFAHECKDNSQNFTGQVKLKYNGTPGVKKIRHISASTIIDRLLRESVKDNTWIFVADTSFRLYVGIKQSGIFQHSSFLNGGRISAAGSIRVEDGRLCRLSPLSGHYRPPTSNFRAFIHALKQADIDTSTIEISHSYAVLLGLETYSKTRRAAKQFMGRKVTKQCKFLNPKVFQDNARI